MFAELLICARDFWTKSHDLQQQVTCFHLRWIIKFCRYNSERCSLDYRLYIYIYWLRVRPQKQITTGTRRLRCNLVTRMSSIRLPWMLGRKMPRISPGKCAGCTPPKKRTAGTREKRVGTQLFYVQISQHCAEWSRWMRMVWSYHLRNLWRNKAFSRGGCWKIQQKGMWALVVTVRGYGITTTFRHHLVQVARLLEHPLAGN